MLFDIALFYNPSIYSFHTKKAEEFPSAFTVWWAHQGSNLGPTGYEPAALPLSYRPNIAKNILSIKKSFVKKQTSNLTFFSTDSSNFWLIFLIS